MHARVLTGSARNASDAGDHTSSAMPPPPVSAPPERRPVAASMPIAWTSASPPWLCGARDRVPLAHPLAHILGDAPLADDQIALAVEPRRQHRLGRAHPKVQHVQDHLQHRR